MADPAGPPPVSGHVEVLERAGARLLVQGWFRLDPEVLQHTTPSLRIGPPGAPGPAWPLRRLRERADLPARDGLPPGHGFQLLMPETAAWETAAAELLVGDAVVALAPASLRAAPARVRGALERPGRHGVSGWLVDLLGRTPQLLVDGRHRIPFPVHRARWDLPFDDGAPEPLFGCHLSLAALGAALRCAHPAATLLDWQPHDLTLLLDGQEIGHEVLLLPRRMGGKLERVHAGEAIGWATEAEAAEEDPTVDLLLGGTRWHSARAATPRADLAANGVGTTLRGGAFRIPVPTRGIAGTPALELRPGHAREPLGSAAGALAPLPPRGAERGSVLDVLPAAGPPPVAIVIPIHNAAADLARCIDSVVRHTTGAARLILLDDASTDPQVAAILARFEGQERIAVHRNPDNLGFTATANRGIALAGRDDVVLLNSDTIVGPGWLDGLRRVAWSGPRVGTVTPLSNNAGAFSVPEFNAENRLPEWFGPADMARLVRQVSLSILPPVPTGNGFCLYIRRDCLDAVGPLDEAAFPRGYGEENDFCMRALHRGFENLVDDRTWVWHRRSASFGQARGEHLQAGQAVLNERYPEYRTLAAMFGEDVDFLTIRWQVRRAVEAALAGGTTPRPRVLFVIATRSGGTPQTNLDLMAALADRYEPWVLRCDGRVMELTAHGAAAPAMTEALTRPIQPGLHHSAEYDRILADLLVRHGFELVHVRHIAWHGLGLTEVCRRLGIPVVFSFHDFYTACPTVKLLDAEGRFCGGRCTGGEADCTAELWPAAAMPPLRDRFVHRWRAMMAEALARCDAFVTTSPFAQATLQDLHPCLAGRDFALIPHGRSFPRMAGLAVEPTIDSPLRVLVPGNIAAAKGAALIAEMAALDQEREVEFHILGNTDAILQEPMPGVVLHGAYDREEFAEKARAVQPHLAAILSIWPETYCHTLTECWAAGIPVLALALGAQAERIAAEGGGWLLEPGTPAGAILQRLVALKRDLGGLRARRNEVLDWQHRIGRHYDTAGMAAAYDALYRRVLAGRRSFGAERAAPAAPPVVLTVGRRERPGQPPGLPTRNRPGREVVFRPASAAFPFGDPATGPGGIVLLGAGALRLHDVPDILGRCAAASLALVVEADEAMAGALAQGGLPAEAFGQLFAASDAVIATTPRAAARLAAAGIGAVQLPAVLDAAAWLTPVAPHPAGPADAPLRLLVFAEDPALAALQPALAGLTALGVAEVVPLGAAPAGADATQAFRAAAARCDLALLPEPEDPRALGCAAAGLVTLRGVGAGQAQGEQQGEPQGETETGAILLPAQPLAWVRAIAELATDPARRATLARRARRHGLDRMVRGGQEPALDALLAGLHRTGPKAGPKAGPGSGRDSALESSPEPAPAPAPATAIPAPE